MVNDGAPFSNQLAKTLCTSAHIDQDLHDVGSNSGSGFMGTLMT